MSASYESSPNRVRDSALKAASQLFYDQGVRAVGMDLIAIRSGIPKTSIYRYFPTKDSLVAAFLQQEDREFWAQWDSVADSHAEEPRSALSALAHWVGTKISRDNYRGCPQMNVAAEFADDEHPARIVAQQHKAAMVRKLSDLCRQIFEEETAVIRAQQIALLFDGAFASGGRLSGGGAPQILDDAISQLTQVA
jgi:AcrR family transcriptional regulator